MVALRVHLDAPIVLELATSLLSMHFGDLQFAAAMLEPSLLLITEPENGSVSAYLRAGLDVSGPLDGGPRPPSVMLGGHLGFGFELRAARLGDRGRMSLGGAHVGFGALALMGPLGMGAECRVLVRDGFGEGSDPLASEIAKPRVGFEARLQALLVGF
jgi:hypothetical protein